MPLNLMRKTIIRTSEWRYCPNPALIHNWLFTVDWKSLMDYSSVPWMMRRGFQPAPPIKSDRVGWPWGIDAQVAYKRRLDEGLRHQRQANTHITTQIREPQREELWSADFFLYNRWVKKFMQWGSVLVFALLIIHDDSCLVYYYKVLFQTHSVQNVLLILM